MKRFLLKDVQLVNRGTIRRCDLLTEGSFISEIAPSISAKTPDTEIIDTKGKYLLPGLIDDQVHFREPGLTHKATIESESRAAIAGGITSYFEMPNTLPQTVTQQALDDKFQRAAATSFANYSFMMGGTNDNLSEILRTDPRRVPALKLFLGSSTGNMLVDDEAVLEKIFANTEMLIAVHCEDEQTISRNETLFRKKYGDSVPIKCHPQIRSTQACYLSSSKAVALAKKTGARLHVFHLSTALETDLFTNKIPLEDKKITAEVCVHHLWFDDSFYREKQSLIKWNPAIKTPQDKEALWKALLDDRIDNIATDHAPHTLAEKQNTYFKAPSGGPLVQHALPAMLETFKQGKISLEKIAEKMCHNPAKIYKIDRRGFLDEGCYADMVLLAMNAPWVVSKKNILYKCKWSPFEGTRFSSQITHSFVNGHLVYHDGKFDHQRRAKQLAFNP